MVDKLSGKVAVITGGTRGLGLAVARAVSELVTAGARHRTDLRCERPVARGRAG